MATRVTAAEVIEIMDTTLTESEINPYVISANVFVTEALSSTSLSANALKEIERWLAAHFAAMTKERQSKKEEAGGAAIEWGVKFGSELEATTYGQVALNLDTTNTLKNLQKGKSSAFIHAVPGT